MCLCVLLMVLLVPNHPETAKNPRFQFPNFALIRSAILWLREKRGEFFDQEKKLREIAE